MTMKKLREEKGDIFELSDCEKYVAIKSKIVKLKSKLIMYRVDSALVYNVCRQSYCETVRRKIKSSSKVNASVNNTGNIAFIFVFVFFAILYQKWDNLLDKRCAIANNYFVMEVSRPVTNCEICRNVSSVIVLQNPSKETFEKYAYTGQPLLVRGATANWTALNTFTFDFFRNVYANIKDAFQSVEEECQFFPFKTEFTSLKEVFTMPQERVTLRSNFAKPWYIGWSNCNPDVAHVLRQHYQRPHFLPKDSESSAIDWIFMGYTGQGASMHLDYVQRPSWQAQISGRKSWHLLPSPECETQCQTVNITVNKGDIILIDTNQWYHDTHIIGEELSITIGSEYD